ncbi:hypothetical protein BVI2075_530103 [Burkholderia vietnamiensis]|nr:hypothetical protein BVI2075_530103 [Burkholderia vietnamiensis]
MVSAAFLWGRPADASGAPGDRYAGLLDAAHAPRGTFGVFVEMEYGCCATSRKSAGIEVAVGEMEAL